MVENNRMVLPREKLTQILEEEGTNCRVAQLFQIIQKAHGISEENYLPWEQSFHAGGTGYIDGITTEDLKMSVMWGIDPHNRPFAVCGYSYREKDKEETLGQESITLFQRNVGLGSSIAGNGVGKKLYLDPSDSDFLSKFQQLVEGKTIENEVVEGKTREKKIYEISLVNHKQLHALQSADKFVKMVLPPPARQ